MNHLRTTEQLSIRVLCRLLGLSRQSYYKHIRQSQSRFAQEEIVLGLVREVRTLHPRIGTLKLSRMMDQDLKFHQIKMGRDKLYSLLRNNGLLVRRHRKKVRTTHSDHPFFKYDNLIIGLPIYRPNLVWVSDITYWKVGTKCWYLTFITDAYSHKIVGYNLADNLEAKSSVRALRMAINNAGCSLQGMVHHSDRGIQYCTHEYTQLLKKHAIKISMTQSGDPLENPIAERVNGIIKNEYLKPLIDHQNLQQAQQLVDQVIERYNKKRPHLSCGLEVPETIHHSKKSLLGKYHMSTYTSNKIRCKP